MNTIKVDLELFRKEKSFQACLVLNEGNLEKTELDLTWLHPEELAVDLGEFWNGLDSFDISCL